MRLVLVPTQAQARQLHTAVQTTPDLYGPVWVTGLVVFLTMLSASLVPILSRIFLDSVPGSPSKYTLANLGYLCGCLYAMLFVFPSVCSLVFKGRGAPEEQLGNLASICLHGYCNLHFVLGATLCLVNNRLWRFCVLLLCGLYSAAAVFLAYAHLPTVPRLIIALLGRSILVLVLFFAY